MQADVILLAGVLGLDVTNPTHAVMLGDATRGLSDLRDFVEYCRAHHAGIEYTTNVQKLDILATRYRREEAIRANAEKFENGERWAAELVELVGAVRTTLKNARATGQNAGFSHIKQNGERVFSLKQLRALASLGTTDYIIARSETGHLLDDLTRSLVRAILKPTRPELPATQQRVMSLVDASARGMEA